MIVAALAIALLAQQMTQEEMISEGAMIGRAGSAMGLCSALGYSVDKSAGAAWAQDFSHRVAGAGWDPALANRAIASGSVTEEAEMAPPTDAGLNAEQLRNTAATYIGNVKARCHRLHDEHAGLISDLDQGDRNADAQLAIMLRGLEP